MPTEDSATVKHVRSQIFRRYVDSSRLEVHVIHGIVYLRGILAPLRSHGEVDLNHEIEIINQTIRQTPGVRHIVWEAIVRG